MTGLGSVDAYNLVTEWNAATPVSNVVPSCNPDPVYQQAPDANGFSWDFTLTLNETAGVGTSFTDFTSQRHQLRLADCQFLWHFHNS